MEVGFILQHIILLLQVVLDLYKLMHRLHIHIFVKEKVLY